MKSKISIICLSPYLGGMELDALKLADLLSLEFEISLCLRADSLLHSHVLQQSKIDCKNKFSIKTFKFFSNFSLPLIWRLRRFFCLEKVNILIVFGSSELKAIIPASLGLGIGLINLHGTNKNVFKKSLFHRLIYSKINAHIALSKTLLENIKFILPIYNHQILRVIPNYFSIIDNVIKDEQRSNNIEIIHVGRIVPGKGQWEALLAFKFAMAFNSNIKISFVGSVEDEVYYSKINEFLLENEMQKFVTFLGFQKDVNYFLKDANVFLYPSYGEGLPGVVFQAFSFGIPILCFENTVFPELLETGFSFCMVENLNQEKLNHGLKKILEDLASQKKLALNNIQIMKDFFSKEKVLVRWKDLISEVIEKLNKS